MVAVSGPLLPVTTPLTGSTEATVGRLLLQVPPAGVLLRVVVRFTHTAATPVIGVGGANTVTVVLRLHPLPLVYVTRVVSAPVDDTPVTTPPVLIEPTPGLAVLHVPEAGVLVSVVVPLTHTPVPPLIAPGSAYTVITAVARQPVPTV